MAAITVSAWERRAGRDAVRIRVLGNTELDTENGTVGIGSERQRRLLAVLAMRCPDTVPVERLVEAVWAETRPSSPANSLATVVTRLRHTLNKCEADAGRLIVSRPPGYALDVPAEMIDANRFADLTVAGRRHVAHGDLDRAIGTLHDALAVWHGPAYAEFDHEDWARAEAQRLHGLWLAAREADIEIRLMSGRHAEALGDIRALIEAEPLSDNLRGFLMRALFADGRQTEALRALDDYRKLLAEETGLEPGPELARLEQRILANDETLLGTPGRPLRGYRLHERLTRTDRGAVFRATQPGLERDVAIEVIGEDAASDADFVRSFELQGQALARLGHAHVVPVIDCWRDPDGAYLVRRLLSGGSLADPDVCDRLGRDGLARVRDQARSALEAAHNAGLVHGPLDADDVQLDDHGTAYLSNFRLGAIDATAEDDLRCFDRLFDALVGPTITRSTPPSDGGRVASPYRGLAPFEASDIDVFFGRSRLVETSLRTLRKHGTAVVVGPSGSGKSSMVRAGVVPALAAGELEGSEHWFVVTMVPGSDPFGALEAAVLRVAVDPPAGLSAQLRDPTHDLVESVQRVLPQPRGAAVVIVDQFEELFTLTVAEERDRFLAALGPVMRNPRSPLRVIATLRADFYDQPLAHPEIASVLTEVTVPVDALSGDELREAIVEPARVVGVDIEPELVGCLVADATGCPGSLPLLEFTLTRLFETRRDNTLTLSAYRSLGGLESAIGDRADEIHDDLGPAGQSACRRLFGRLVSVTEGAETRRRVRLRELRAAETDPAVLDDVIERFVSARLLVSDRDTSTREPTLEVAHEALFGEWTRLAGWLRDDRDMLTSLRHLATAAENWRSTGDDGELYRGARLVGALALVADAPDRLTPDEVAFVDASRQVAEADEQRRQRTNRRLRASLLATAVLLVAALVAGLVAVGQRNRADDRAADAELQAAAAEGARAVADIERLTALARSSGAVPRHISLLAALEAHRLAPTSETLNALHFALTTEPRFQGTIGAERMGGTITALVDGRRVVTHTSTTLEVWDLADRRQIQAVPFPGADAATSLRSLRSAASSDGSVLVATAPHVTAVYDGSTGDTVATIDHPDRVARAMAVSATGERLAIGFDDGTVEVRTLEEPSTVVATHTTPAAPEALTLTWQPGGAAIAIGSEREVVIWEPGGASTSIPGVVPTLSPGSPGPSAPVLVFSPDGDRLVMSGLVDDLRTGGDVENALRVLDTESLDDVQAPLRVGQRTHRSLDWLDPVENTVVATGQGRVEVIDLDDGSAEPLGISVHDEASVVLPALGLIARETGSGLDLHSIDGSSAMVRLVPLPPGAAAAWEAGGTPSVDLDPAGRRILFTSVQLPTVESWITELDSDGGWTRYRTADGDVPVAAFGSASGITAIGATGGWYRVDWEGNRLGPSTALAPDTARGIPFYPSASGERMYLLFADSDVLYDSTTEFTEIRRLPMLEAPSGCCARPGFSTDDTLFHRPDGQGGTELYEATTGEPLPFGHQREVLLMGPWDTWFLDADAFGTLRLRDQTTGEPIGPPLAGADGLIYLVLPTSDAARFLALDSAATARVWDVETGTQVGRTIDSMARGGGGWSADGRWLWLLRETEPGAVTLEVWNFDTESWPEIACDLAGRNMTEVEWERYGPRTIERRATCPEFLLEAS